MVSGERHTGGSHSKRLLLFHAQPDTSPFEINADDFDLHHVPHGDHLQGVFHVTVSHLRDVHQAVLLDPDVHKNAKIYDDALTTIKV